MSAKPAIFVSFKCGFIRSFLSFKFSIFGCLFFECWLTTCLSNLLIDYLAGCHVYEWLCHSASWLCSTKSNFWFRFRKSSRFNTHTLTFFAFPYSMALMIFSLYVFVLHYWNKFYLVLKWWFYSCFRNAFVMITSIWVE